MAETVKILIDLYTLRPNPHAGNTVLLVEGVTTETRQYAVGSELHTHIATGTSGCEEVLVRTEPLVEVPRGGTPDEKGRVLISVKQDKEVERVRHPPEPKWLFSYLPVTRHCLFCEHPVDLRYTRQEDEECPSCDASGYLGDQFQWSFETVDEALVRRESLPPQRPLRVYMSWWSPARWSSAESEYTPVADGLRSMGHTLTLDYDSKEWSQIAGSVASAATRLRAIREADLVIVSTFDGLSVVDAGVAVGLGKRLICLSTSNNMLWITRLENVSLVDLWDLNDRLNLHGILDQVAEFARTPA